MCLTNRISDWIHPFQSIIKIVSRLLAENNKKIASEYRGNELTTLSLQSKHLGITPHSYVEGREIIVSLTTHGKRLYEVYKAIESIMQGTFLPNKIILWLSDSLLGQSLPETLVRQKKRGLQIEYVQDLGPHTKLIPALKKYPDDIIVTIDDDMYYQYDMLENLIKAYQKYPDSILSNRVTVMNLNADGSLKSYLDWDHYTHPKVDSPRNLITGVEGCLYPPHSLSDEVFNEKVFLEICRYADDVWFTSMALLRGTSIKHVYTHYANGCAGAIENLSMQDIGLYHENDSHLDCRNDKQIAAVFDRYQLLPIVQQEFNVN